MSDAELRYEGLRIKADILVSIEAAQREVAASQRRRAARERFRPIQNLDSRPFNAEPPSVLATFAGLEERLRKLELGARVGVAVESEARG